MIRVKLSFIQTKFPLLQAVSNSVAQDNALLRSHRFQPSIS
jgi:hypothetical protein